MLDVQTSAFMCIIQVYKSTGEAAAATSASGSRRRYTSVDAARRRSNSRTIAATTGARC